MEDNVASPLLGGIISLHKEDRMFDQQLAKKAAKNLRNLRETKPLIPHITYWIDSMLKAGKRANELNIPIILDPVGSGATKLRTESAKRLMDEVRINVVRGNASEVLSLAHEGSRTKGVDAIHSVDEAADAAVALSRELDTTLAITGKVDLITYGERICMVHNGHELMGYVTVVIGAFLAMDQNSVEAATTGLAYFGLAGEKAASKAQAPGSFQIALLDALYTIDEKQLEEGAKIQT
jgi:hydroxyethylthiazole kinase